MLTFCVFSDYHYWKTHYPQSADGLQAILARADTEHADFIIHCGDFCHNAPEAPELVKAYTDNPYHIPAFGVIGNHEVEAADDLNDVLRVYGMQHQFEYRDIKGYRLIILDTNYFVDPDSGELLHNPPRSHSRPNGDHLTPEQLAWLERTIEDSPYPCILFSHATFESAVGCPEAETVREILGRANEKTPGKVLMCLNGHYHRNNIAKADGIVWFDVNAVYNVEWQPKENTLLPEGFRSSARMAKNCCYSRDPLCAIVRVDGAHITIEGMESEFLYGASPEKLGWPDCNRFGRRAEARISSAEF